MAAAQAGVGRAADAQNVVRRRGTSIKLRFYIDRDSGLPHIHNHGVREDEVEQVLRHRGEDRAGKEGSRVAVGRTKAGRYLRVIYVPEPEPDSGFVVTACELTGKPLLLPASLYASRSADSQGVQKSAGLSVVRPHRS